jgi:DNA-binding LacI/PurR family transcriptional regulator
VARVTLQTIADRVGVSRMTVSNAFSRPDQLSQELRDKILTVAHQLGYVGPDPVARALVRGTTGAVGVLLTDSLRYAFTDEVATGFLGSVVDELAPTGLALTLLTAEERSDVQPARDVAVDGALVYSCRPHSAARDWLVRRQMPLVYVDQDPAPDISSVNVDDRGGARTAAQHLIDLGHRHIAVLTLAPDARDTGADGSPGTPHPQRERHLGWLGALTDAGVEAVSVVEASGHTDAAAAEAAGQILSLDPRPTGVLCFSDVLALGMVHAVHRSGLSVPDDVSVVGFDDSPIATRSEPSLTTVRQDVAEKGRLATELLREAIEANRIDAPIQPRQVVLPTTLVVRDSTAPPSG